MIGTVSQFGFIVALGATALLTSIQSYARQGSETVEAAARKAFDKGSQELAAGNHTGAITLLKTAVRIQPQNAAYNHKLAKAFLAAQEYHNMWVYLRKATVLELSNEEYANDFLRMWRYHDLEGMLNVGTQADKLLKALGEPDRRIEDGQRMRWIYGFMAIDFGSGADGGKGVFRVIDLRGFTAEAATETEKVSVSTDPNKWTVAHHQVSRSNDNLELTLKNEKIQNWTELFSKQRFPLMARTGATVEGMVDSILKSLKATDPNVEFNIISSSPTEIHYHWITNKTEESAAQHEVAKIMKGKKDFYRVAYVKKTDRLSESEFANWSKVIGDATLVPVKQPMMTQTDSESAIAAWDLGKNLGFAALLRGKHSPADSVTPILLKVSKSAQKLGVNVPPPGKLTDDVSADTAAAIHYLLDTAGKPVYNSLQDQHGDIHSGLFELATKSTLLTMLYQPGDSTSKSFSAAIKRSAAKADLGEEVWKPLTDMIDQDASAENVSKEIRQFQKRVAAAIQK